MSKRLKSAKIPTFGILVLATLLLVYSFLTVNVRVVADSAQHMMANALVGTSANVPPNPYNTLDQQLSEKQTRLNEREAALSVRENSGGALSSSDVWGVYSFVMSAVLVVIVGINFYFDLRRGRPNPLSRKFSVDLR